MVPSLLNAISGSLFPVEFAFGAVVTPDIGSVEIKGVLLNAGIGVGPASAVGREAVAPAPAGCRATAAVASTASAPNNGNLFCIRIPSLGGLGPAQSLRLFRSTVPCYLGSEKVTHARRSPPRRRGWRPEPQNEDAETVRPCRAIGGDRRAWVAGQPIDDEAETIGH
jgi:hypothetical protein